MIRKLLFFGVFAVASSIIGLPFELYSIFVIEEKFGFNKCSFLKRSRSVDYKNRHLLGDGFIYECIRALAIIILEFFGKKPDWCR